MPFRTGPYRPWLWSFAAVALAAGPVAAQPPSPLELVRGLRENGQVDLALEYLKELEGRPLAADDKAALPLERAKCLLDASEEEADEGTRLGMVSEAKEGLNGFLIAHPKHPRAVEALLALAKLTALDAKEQLNRARRMEVPPAGEGKEEGEAREAAQDKQKVEAAKARPLFLLAAQRFGEASAIIRARLDDKALDPAVRKALEREAFEADLAGGINQFNTAETYMPASRVTGPEKGERNKFLEQSKGTFGKLADGPPTNRTVWVARAWSAEVTFEQDDFNKAAAEVLAILKSNVLESEDGKRLARFFQLRRNYFAALGEKSLPKVLASEQELRGWLRVYGNARKPSPEVFAVRYYLARVLQSLAETSIGPPPKGGKPVVISATARAQLTEAERGYRALAQSDHDFTARAARQRMAVVRKLLGDADQPAESYTTFETAQMASLIQMSKLAAEEGKKAPDEKKVQALRLAAVALLERSRELATPQDNAADVTDVLMRLIYFYQLTDQPYETAVLGEHVARTIKGTGGKAALAGLLGVNGYVIASTRVKGDDPELVAAARRADRDRAYALARFLDEKFPNDNATDMARHRLASMLVEDKRHSEAFEVLLKVRPVYAQITSARLLEGYLAQQLVNAKEAPLPDAKRAEVFKRAVTDLRRVPKPAPVAQDDEVRAYLSVRCRLASLLFAQGRVDPAAEQANPGYKEALAIAEEVIGTVGTFDHMVTTAGGVKTLNAHGLEMTMLAQDTHARAVYLRARDLMAAADKLPPPEQKAKLDEAEKSLAPTLAAVQAGGPLFAGTVKGWADGKGDLIDPAKPDSEENRDPQSVAVQKQRVATLAAAADKSRVEVILTGFRLRVKQSKAAEAGALLDLMVKAGGTVEDNLPVLELLSREMAVQMVSFRKQGKKKEAEDVGTGLGILITKISAVPKLTPAMILFLGQMFQGVGENDKAVDMLKQIKPPEFADWDKKKPEDFPAELRGKVQNQIRDYAIAQLTIARALCEGKKFDESEKMLQAIIGTNEKPGWGSTRLYFRRELAAVYEGRGEAAGDNVKAANPEWSKALREWTSLFNLHKARLTKLTPQTTPEQVRQYRNAFADAYFDVQRCRVKANQQLVKDAAKLQKTYDDVGKNFADMEKQIPAADWEPNVQHRYADLLKETPPVMAAYRAAGGKMFLERLP